MRYCFICLFIFVVILASPITAQTDTNRPETPGSSLQRHAETYFERQAYRHAIRLFTKIVIKHPESQHAKLRLADCYRLLRQPGKAAYWFDQAMDDQQISSAHVYHYASVLAENGEYQKAKKWYYKYLKDEPHDSRALAALESLHYYEQLIGNQYLVKQLEIKLQGGVFSPAPYRNGLVVVGEGNTGGLARKVATWNEEPYFDLYYVPIANGKPGNPRYLDSKLNSVYHEGPVTFFDQGKKVILTRSAGRKGTENRRNLQLMISEQSSSGKWSIPRKLFANPNYSNGHPTVDIQGKVIYFSSDKPGGYGGSDLYRSEYIDGTWTEPVNLGPEVNTAGNELFPNLDSEGNLYYSTDGRGGLGGLDIFRFDKEANSVVNLEYPINSPSDDFGIVWQKDLQQGYFSSNRNGVDRVFSFRKIPHLAKVTVPDN